MNDLSRNSLKLFIEFITPNISKSKEESCYFSLYLPDAYLQIISEDFF